MDTKASGIKQYFRKNKSLSVIAICLLICLVISGGVSTFSLFNSFRISQQLGERQTEYDELENAYSLLSDQNDELQLHYKNLQSEINSYKDQQSTIDEQKKTIEDLSLKLTDVQEKYDALSTENAELKENISDLKETITELEEASGSGGGGSGSGGGTFFVPESSAGNNDSAGEMVWLSETGSKYHSIPDCGRMNPNKARQVTKASAESQGYDACSKCW